MKTAESGLVAKVRATQIPFGNLWEDAIRMGVRLAADQQTLPVDVNEPELVLTTIWADAETRNDLAEAQTMEILSGLGVSEHTIFSRLGLDYEQEQQWRAQEKATLDDQAGRLLDAGAAVPELAAGMNGAPLDMAAYQGA